MEHTLSDLASGSSLGWLELLRPTKKQIREEGQTRDSPQIPNTVLQMGVMGSIYFGIIDILTKYNVSLSIAFLASFLACEIDVPGVIRALGKNSKSEWAIPWRTSYLPPPQPIHFHLRIWREQEHDSATQAFSSACPSFGLALFLPPQWRLLTLQRMFLLSAPSEAEQCGPPSVCADVQRKKAGVPKVTVTLTGGRKVSICGSRYYKRKQARYCAWYFPTSTHKIVAKARPRHFSPETHQHPPQFLKGALFCSPKLTQQWQLPSGIRKADIGRWLRKITTLFRNLGHEKLRTATDQEVLCDCGTQIWF